MNLHSLASDMVQTALACEKALPGRANADEHDLARHILVEPDHAARPELALPIYALGNSRK